MANLRRRPEEALEKHYTEHRGSRRFLFAELKDGSPHPIEITYGIEDGEIIANGTSAITESIHARYYVDIFPRGILPKSQTIKDYCDAKRIVHNFDTAPTPQTSPAKDTALA